MLKMKLIIRDLEQQPYLPTWEAMRDFTHHRETNTPDELWLLEHPPIFTQGQAGKSEHILNPHDISVIKTDRGGQITYHGPGQLMVYTLFDLRRLKIGVRGLVCGLETCVIELLRQYGIRAEGKRDAPGVYVEGRDKICSIGLRVRRGCSYHGIALNVKMDLTPFSYINPCGFRSLKMAQIQDVYPHITLAEVKKEIIGCIQRHFGYTLEQKHKRDDAETTRGWPGD